MEKRKRFKGSAVVCDSGDFMFTPYNIGGGQKKLKTLAATTHGYLATTKKGYVVKIYLPLSSKISLTEVVKIVIALLKASRAAGHNV